MVYVMQLVMLGHCLQVYREQAPLTDQQLRQIVRAQMVRQISGHTVAIDERRR